MNEDQEVDPRRGRYPCPRCGSVLQVPSPGEYFLAMVWPRRWTVVGASRGYVCSHCGPIPFAELPRDAKVIRLLMWLLFAFVLFFVGVALFAKYTLP